MCIKISTIASILNQREVCQFLSTEQAAEHKLIFVEKIPAFLARGLRSGNYFIASAGNGVKTVLSPVCRYLSSDDLSEPHVRIRGQKCMQSTVMYTRTLYSIHYTCKY